jgi:ABC-type antimicrobial peptide transport system permease subunit
VIRTFFPRIVRLSVLGTVLGLPLSATTLYFLAAEFGEVIPLNMPIVSAGIALSVVTVAAFASWIPARRAAVVDPLVAIRAD